MDFDKIAEAVSEYDVSPDDVEELFDELGMVYAEVGSKRQFQQYEPDEAHMGAIASVPDNQTPEQARATLFEMCWDGVETELARKKESYEREE